MSTKARTFLLQGKEIPETSLRINTVCNFQTMKSVVDEIPNIMSPEYLKISLEDNLKQPPEVFCVLRTLKVSLEISLKILLEDRCVGVSFY